MTKHFSEPYGCLDPGGLSSGRLTNLVVVRAGDASLHEAWTRGPEPATFDLVVSYFGDDPERFHAQAHPRHDRKGGKWDGLADLFATRPELLDLYEYVWLPDDDLACDTATINRMFALMRQHGLRLAQPALTLDSYHSHLGYVRSRSFSVRFSDAVEVMAPCMEASLLRKVLSIASGTRSGWGLDPVWTRLNHDNACKSAILDECTIWHTRPIGGPLYDVIAKNGASPVDEAADMRRRFGQARHYPLTYEAIDRRGRRWRSQRMIALRMWSDLLMDKARIPHLRSKTSITQLLRRQLFKTIDLRPLQFP